MALIKINSSDQRGRIFKQTQTVKKVQDLGVGSC